MKKYTLLLLLAFIGCFLLPVHAFAVDFSIEETKIDAFLQENGMVHVTELHTYEFDGDFNGITRGLIPKKGAAITDFNAQENGKQLEVEKEDATYIIHRPGEDETITIELSYIIENGVEVYEDMAQFYWPFFDSNNETDYENMTITVHPPKTTSDVIAYGYHSAYGTEKIENDGVVIFEMGLVEGGEKGNIRVAYDRDIFSAASVTHNETIRDKLLHEQQELADKEADFLNAQKNWENVAIIVISVLSLYFLLLLFYAWRKRQATLLEAERQTPARSIVPKEVMSMPATIYYFRHFTTGLGDLLTIGMMDLVRKGNIEIRGDDTYHLINKQTEHKHEGQLIHLLFRKLAEKGTFSFEQLESLLKSSSNQQMFRTELAKYQGLIMQEVKSHQLFNQHAKLRWFTGVVSLLFIPLMIVLGIYELYMWLFISLALMVVLLTFAFIFKTRTVKGQIIKQEWDHFKNHFSGLESSSWYTLSDDDKERALIFTTGINDKKLAEKNRFLINNQKDDQEESDELLFLMLALSTTAHLNFGAATQTYAESGSGSTSYSGTGTGVGGGGGGSGAF
ncbi:DUF2207 domain-containing protein [Oceanobacillus luteolus]|uniref:DUF2207 domain-containing protein n=1 Tax=Oceanobacillus luteolus TaxID=1274358 RepID=A0ABW4HNZ2_9BACI